MKLPTPAEVVRHTAAQIEALAQLPESILIFNQSLNTFAQTVGRLDALVRRVDALTAPFEAPIKALVPVIEQYSVEELADMLQRSVMPALQMMGDTQSQIRSIATSVEQLIRVMEDLFGRLQEIPGLSLMSRLMPAAARPEAAQAGGGAPADSPGPAPSGPGTALPPRDAPSRRRTSGSEEVRR